MNIFVQHFANNLLVNNNLVGHCTVNQPKRGNGYPSINLIPGTRHDIGLVIDMLAHQVIVEVGHTFFCDEVGNGSHLDVNQFYIILLPVSTRGELERLEPLIHHLALQRHIIAVMQTRQLGS